MTTLSKGTGVRAGIYGYTVAEKVKQVPVQQVVKTGSYGEEFRFC